MSFLVKLAFACICIASSLKTTDSARILGLFPTHSKSHLIIYSALAEALAERGHNVTVVSTHTPVKKILPYRYIYTKVPLLPATLFSDAVNKRPAWYKSITNFMYALLDISNSSLHHPHMQKLMKEESFDLVIHGSLWNDFLYGVAAHFKCPLIVCFTVRPFSNINDLVGNPQEFSYVPTMHSNAKQPIGFLDRVKNFLVVTIFRESIYRTFLWWKQEQYYRANFPSNKYPSYEAMKKNVSLVFTSHHFSQTPIRPNVPAMVEIGGIQIKDKPEPLPEDIQSILDNANQYGVIYFSLGTNIYNNHLNASKVKAIFNVFSKLPQTVLCKWTDPELPSDSPNLVFKQWLPQSDVLHHPNVRLFVTHAGQGSVAEAEYHGVPMVAIPLINDQYVNVENLVNAGFGLGLQYKALTEESLRNAVVEVLSNKTYKDNIQRFARIYKDRPQTPKETAVYWVEYVLRHKGAPHLQSPAVHMNRFQLLSLDVIAFLGAILFIACRTIRMIISSIKRMYARRSKKELKKNL